MAKISSLLIGTILAFIFFSVITGVAYAADCNDSVTATITSVGGAGRSATASITNNGSVGCVARITFSGYKVFIQPEQTGWLDTQVLNDSKTISISGGQTQQVSINTADCKTQLDVHKGEVFPKLSTTHRIGSLLIVSAYTSDPLCVSCTDECSDSERECVGNGWKVCGNFDSDSCKEWGPIHDCESFTTCSNGSCNNNKPTVDLNASGTVTCNKNATLAWTSTNAVSCNASNGWTGSKATLGSETVGNFTGSKTFTLTCSNPGGSASDSVTIDSIEDTLNVGAGSDMEVDAGKSIELNGSVSGSGTGGTTGISWSCTGGTLTNRTSLTPTFKADSDEDDRTFTCTITATNECGSDTDTMKVRVNHKETSNFNISLTARPDEDCAPLNDVDLVAKVTNYGDNDKDYTYYFDCDNDGDWEKTVTSSNTSYTATNLCDYRNIGSYTAKVKVTSNGRTATDTAIIRANDCRVEKKEIGNVSITKNVRNITGGTGYLGSVAANPGDTVSYKIILTGVSGKVDNVFVSDIMPNGISNIRDLQIDGYRENDNLATGFNIGSLSSGQTKTITYTATVAGEYNFGYGQTTLTNTAMVTADGNSTRANAAVTVYRHAVQGATTVSTGFDGNAAAGLGVAMAGLILSLGWIFRSQALAFMRKDPRQVLRAKIAFIKANGLAR